MSKEEIVSNIKWALRAGCKRACSPSDIIDDECKCGRDIIHILDTYAQEIAVGFAEYINEGVWAKYESGLWYPFEPQDDDIGLITPQLFQRFLTNKNEKK